MGEWVPCSIESLVYHSARPSPKVLRPWPLMLNSSSASQARMCEGTLFQIHPRRLWRSGVTRIWSEETTVAPPKSQLGSGPVALKWYGGRNELHRKMPMHVPNA